MATDQYLIAPSELALAALPGNARIEAQPIQSIMPAVGVHGLSAQFGALRPLLCTNAWELSVANYILRCAVTWRAWHGRRRREKMDGADEKCSPVS